LSGYLDLIGICLWFCGGFDWVVGFGLAGMVGKGGANGLEGFVGV
jgi:hypothetical protein